MIDLDLDELEELVRAIPEQDWCLHPQGFSVWTGTEYSTEGNSAQEVVCKSAMTDVVSQRRMEVVAAFGPKVLLELIKRARALSFEYGEE